ncbi:MAG: GAF domain-containing protein [Pseudonocardia sp.]|nr:GAF domain-containing protein [Pseudonocardia sp.]
MTVTTSRPAPPATDVLGRLLALLAEDAPATEVSALAAELADLADGPRRGTLTRAAADAARVRNMLDLHEQREREAQALYETARDLTSLRGTDDVLRAIVDRVRRLLGSDSAYIALVDEASGDAFMRVTSGTRTTAIRSVRQRPGYGVGGHVLATGQPMATSNYRTDPAIRRDPSVASAVGADAIVSIVGVPIRVAGAVIGVLFAADRTERTFDQAEIALLTSLAAHASVVIENARLYERLQADTDDLRRAGTRLATQRHALERAAFAHEQLMPLVLHRADVGHFARTLSRILDGTAVVLDESGRALAEARTPTSPAVADLRSSPLPPGARALPVRAGDENFGWLLFARRAALTETDERTLERSAQTAALLLLMGRQTALVEQELRAELVADLLAERAPDWAALQRRAERSGVVDFHRPHTAVVASVGEDATVSRRRVLAAAAELAARYGGIAGEHAGTAVLLLPGIEASTAATLVPDELGRALRTEVTAGTAGPATSARGIRALHRGAARCHRLLLALGRAGHGASLAELGVLGMVLEGTTPEEVHRLLERTLGPLLRYDRVHDSPLVETVERYFDTGQNPPATARELGVHVNTVYQRLDRVDAVLGGRTWREPAGALEMQIVLQLHRSVTGPVPGRPEDAAADGCG